MKKNDWLEKLSLADKKYVDEADPALSYTEKPAPKRRIKWGRVTAMAACFLAVLFTAALFVPYSYSPPSVKRYADSEYYSVIEKLNIFNYDKSRPKEKNLFQSIGKALSSLNKDTGEIAGMDYSPTYGDGPSDNKSETKYQEITDNQVEGVTEGDIIKRSDKYVYHISNATLYVYPITGKAEQPVGQYSLNIPVEDGAEMYIADSETEMYLSNDCKTVTVITSFYGKSKKSEKNNESFVINIVMVRSLDVSDPENITEKSVFTVDGSYNTSRMVDGKLLLITSYRPQNVDFSDESTFVPTVSHDNIEEKLPADCIFAPEKLDDGCYTVVTLLDEDGLDTEGVSAFLSYTGCIYVNKEDVFLTRRFNENKVTKTEITRISYKDTIESKGSVTVDGYLNNQYSLDVYDGYLRAVTTLEERDDNIFSGIERVDIGKINASLYCIDLDDLSIAAEVKRFAPDGESVRSVRFDGNNAYVCTSIKTLDPVFFFDLSDINNITVKDTGTIEGFSTSLVNFKDGFLIGIGRGASGDLKIEVYEETADGVRSVSSYTREHVDYSTDYKAYYIDRENGLIGLAVHKYRDTSEIHTEYVLLHFDGYKLREHAKCTIEGDLYTIRGVYIDGILYAFGNGCMKFVSRFGE